MRIANVKRVLAIMLFAFLLTAMLPAVESHAAAPTSVKVQGVEVSGGGYWNTATGVPDPSASDQTWTVSYDTTTSTLTLKDAAIKGDSSAINGVGISSDGDLTIRVEAGTSTIDGEKGTFAGSTGIHCNGVLTIGGTGTLTVSSYAEDSDRPAGGSGVNTTGDLVIEGNVTLKATGYATGNATGINAGGTLTVKDQAKVTATASSAIASSGMRAGTGITISGDAVVTAESLGSTGGTSAGSFGMLISGTGDINIATSKEVKAIAGEFKNRYGSGMEADKVTISQGTVTAIGGSSTHVGDSTPGSEKAVSSGIRATTSVSVSGAANVTATGKSAETSYGINTGTITIGKSATATAISDSTFAGGGTKQAMQAAPEIDQSYNTAVVTASTSSDGSGKVDYNPANIGTYLYLQVAPGTAPVITTTALQDGTAGTPYNQTLTATSELTVTWSVTGLPAGLTLNTGTGAITGTPTTAGAYNPEITAANTAGTTSQNMQLNINQEPVFNTDLSDKTVTEETELSFLVSVSGYPQPTLQWQVDKNDGNGWQDISGETGSSYKIANVPLSYDGYQYQCVAENTIEGSLKTVTSKTAILTVERAKSKPQFTNQPSDQSVYTGQSATFAVEVQGYPEPTLQWQVSKDGGTVWENLDGETRKTYTITAAAIDQNEYQYRCLASNETESDVESDAATLLVSNENLTVKVPYVKTVKQAGNKVPPKEDFQLQVQDDAANVTVQNDVIATDGAGTYAGVLEITMSVADFRQHYAPGILITEKKGSAEGWTYDAATWRVIAEVNGVGEVVHIAICSEDDPDLWVDTMAFANTYTAEDAGQPQNQDKPKDKDGGKASPKEGEVPQTGDAEMPVAVWMALMALSVMIILIIFRHRTRMRR